jgi:pilus assembly protein CpaB
MNWDIARIEIMKKPLLIFFGFLLGCGGGATWLALDQKSSAPVAAVATALPPHLEEVLVATHKLSTGAVVQASDLAWQGWPRDTALKGVIRKSEAPAAMDEFKDWVVRGALIAGEPIRREKLTRGGAAADLSSFLAPGHSAVAITIGANGATADGGFIPLNERVDVIRVTKTAIRSGEASKTLVADVRLLALAPNPQDKRGQPPGATATLELDPHQAEKVILAQRGGQLSLALHPMQDARKSEPVLALDEKHDRAVAVVRAGR